MLVNITVLGLIMFNQLKLWEAQSTLYSDKQTYREEPQKTLHSLFLFIKGNYLKNRLVHLFNHRDTKTDLKLNHQKPSLQTNQIV